MSEGLSGGALIRRCVVASPGNVLVSSDYDQLELRVLAGVASIAGMKRAIDAGEDLHSSTASLIFGDDFTPWQRQLAKMTNFLIVFGGGAGKLAEQAGIPLDQAKEVIQGYHSAYPEVRRYSRKLQDAVLASALTPDEIELHRDLTRRRWDLVNALRDETDSLNIEALGKQQRSVERKLSLITRNKTGWIRSPIGARIPVPAAQAYKAVNYIVQGTGRDVTARALVRLDNAGLSKYLVLVVHDEILADVPEAKAETVARRIGELMSEDFEGVPITATGEIIGDNWGNAYAA